MMANALLLPSPRWSPAHAGLGRTRAVHPAMAQPRGSHWDAADFLNSPISFIAMHPELFSKDLQQMAAYQVMVKSNELRLWGDLPEALDLCAKGAAYLRQKSANADQLAQVIMSADEQTLADFVKDAKFEEKKAFLQAIASLPKDDNGMLAINRVAAGMLEAGALPLIPQFEKDLDRVTAKVAEVNDALMELDNKYSMLFLSVRKVAKLADAAARASESVGGE